RSPTDVQPVFDAIADSALRLCDAKHGNVFLFDGKLIHLAAVVGTDRDGTEAVRLSFPQTPGPASATTRAIRTRQPATISDVLDDPEFQLMDVARVQAFRSVMSIPMLRAGEPIGASTVTRADAGPFFDAQLALLQTFADQAAIAIENVRLFTELQEKNRALTEAHAQVTESLEQQTATSEVLKIISRSTFDLQPVLRTLLENAARLCGAEIGSIFRPHGDAFFAVTEYGTPPEMRDVLARPQCPPAVDPSWVGPGSNAAPYTLSTCSQTRSTNVPSCRCALVVALFWLFPCRERERFSASSGCGRLVSSRLPISRLSW